MGSCQDSKEYNIRVLMLSPYLNANISFFFNFFQVKKINAGGIVLSHLLDLALKTQSLHPCLMLAIINRKGFYRSNRSNNE